MKIKTLRNGLAIAVAIGAILSATAPSFLGTTVYSATPEVVPAENKTYSNLFDGPASFRARRLITDPVATSRKSQKAPLAFTGGVVTEWNQEAVRLTLLTTSNLAPVQQTRVMAIVQVAVHDAVNGITGKYATYLSPGAAPANASPEAAAIAAAHHALRNLFASQPTQVAMLDTLYFTSLAAHGLSTSDPGIDYGRSAAAAILALRANDNSAQAQFSYTAPGAGNPGVWVPLTSLPALLPGWGEVTPFVLHNVSQFHLPPPPALDSERYAQDYNEIKAIGKSNSATRSFEQTQIATFWLGSPVAIWNQPLTQLVATREFDLSTTARSFALVYLAAADSSIVCWAGKYEYNFWRPQPAIQRGAEDGNDSTAPDPTWAPLFATPRHPDYASGHATNSSAIATILQLIFGDEPGVPINSTITGITRQWSTFSEGVDEVIDARVYSGIHFRTADEVGSRQGGQVAHFVWTHALRPCPKSKGKCFSKIL
ncbi:MAG TPA: vanadium-dependent haloperoxidase [Pyrinomonadaceae bacterium]|nr:vanadium-dependent haloperoxidase [Pyrinomonadaceae bacterium]